MNKSSEEKVLNFVATIIARLLFGAAVAVLCFFALLRYMYLDEVGVIAGISLVVGIVAALIGKRILDLFS